MQASLLRYSIRSDLIGSLYRLGSSRSIPIPLPCSFGAGSLLLLLCRGIPLGIGLGILLNARVRLP